MGSGPDGQPLGPTRVALFASVPSPSSSRGPSSGIAGSLHVSPVTRPRDNSWRGAGSGPAGPSSRVRRPRASLGDGGVQQGDGGGAGPDPCGPVAVHPRRDVRPTALQYGAAVMVLPALALLGVARPARVAEAVPAARQARVTEAIPAAGQARVTEAVPAGRSATPLPR